MRSVMTVMIAGVILGGAFASTAEAGDGHHSKHSRGYESRYHDDDDQGYRRSRGYWRPHDVVVIRDYYRPYYRPVPRGYERMYYRGGYMPVGWERRIRPVPVYLEPEFVVVPQGYRRGIIDGRAVVYNNRGFILDVAVLF